MAPFIVGGSSQLGGDDQVGGADAAGVTLNAAPAWFRIAMVVTAMAVTADVAPTPINMKGAPPAAVVSADGAPTSLWLRMANADGQITLPSAPSRMWAGTPSPDVVIPAVDIELNAPPTRLWLTQPLPSAAVAIDVTPTSVRFAGVAPNGVIYGTPPPAVVSIRTPSATGVIANSAASVWLRVGMIAPDGTIVASAAPGRVQIGIPAPAWLSYSPPAVARMRIGVPPPQAIAVVQLAATAGRMQIHIPAPSKVVVGLYPSSARIYFGTPAPARAVSDVELDAPPAQMRLGMPAQAASVQLAAPPTRLLVGRPAPSISTAVADRIQNPNNVLRMRISAPEPRTAIEGQAVTSSGIRIYMAASAPNLTLSKIGYIVVKHNSFGLVPGDEDSILYTEGSMQVEFMKVLAHDSPDSGKIFKSLTYNGETVYQYRVQRDYDGTGANAWDAGQGIVNTGKVGYGFIDQYSFYGITKASQIATARLGPAIAIHLRTGTNARDIEERAVFGRLGGYYQYAIGANTFGMAAGEPTKTWIGAESSNGFVIFNGSVPLGQWAPSGTLKIGTNISAAATTHFIVFNTSTSYNSETFAAGTVLIGDNSAGKGNVLINATTLQIRNGTTAVFYLSNAVLADGTYGFINLPISLGLGSGIYQGTGTFSSPVTGIKFYNSGGIGRLTLYKAGAESFTLNTDGSAVWALGAGMLNNLGMQIVGTTYNDLVQPAFNHPSYLRGISFIRSDDLSTIIGSLQSSWQSLGYHQMTLASRGDGAETTLEAYSTISGIITKLRLISTGTGKTTPIFAIERGALTYFAINTTGTTFYTNLGVQGGLVVDSNASVGGALSITGLVTMTAGFTANAPATVVGQLTVTTLLTSGASNAVFIQTRDTGVNWGLYGSGGIFRIWSDTGGDMVRVDSSGNAYKASGAGSFLAISDERTKTVKRPYLAGLDEVLQIEPVWYEFNGLANTMADGIERVGALAQRMRTVMPETVRVHAEDFADLQDVLVFDMTNVTWATVNAIKELNQRLERIEGILQV